jgi:hypothetical protein
MVSARWSIEDFTQTSSPLRSTPAKKKKKFITGEEKSFDRRGASFNFHTARGGR